MNSLNSFKMHEAITNGLKTTKVREGANKLKPDISDGWLFKKDSQTGVADYFGTLSLVKPPLGIYRGRFGDNTLLLQDLVVEVQKSSEDDSQE